MAGASGGGGTLMFMLGLIFSVITLPLVLLTLLFVLGKHEYRFSGRDLALFTGIGPIGVTRRERVVEFDPLLVAPRSSRGDAGSVRAEAGVPFRPPLLGTFNLRRARFIRFATTKALQESMKRLSQTQGPASISY